MLTLLAVLLTVWGRRTVSAVPRPRAYFSEVGGLRPPGRQGQDERRLPPPTCDGQPLLIAAGLVGCLRNPVRAGRETDFAYPGSNAASANSRGFARRTMLEF